MRLSRYWMTGCMALVLVSASPIIRARDDERTQKGWISMVSKHSPRDTVRLLEQAAREQGMSVFAKLPWCDARTEIEQPVDEAAQAQVLVLGSEPDLTPAVQAGAGSNIQLPLELIVATRPDGTTEVLVHDVAALTRGQEVPAEWADSVSGLSEVVGRALS